jgi:hypothetical protein
MIWNHCDRPYLCCCFFLLLHVLVNSSNNCSARNRPRHQPIIKRIKSRPTCRGYLQRLLAERLRSTSQMKPYQSPQPPVLARAAACSAGKCRRHFWPPWSPVAPFRTLARVGRSYRMYVGLPTRRSKMQIAIRVVDAKRQGDQTTSRVYAVRPFWRSRPST